MCTDCPAGRFSDAVGVTECAGQCAAGSISSPGAQESCDLCPAGQYSPDAGGVNRDYLSFGYGNLVSQLYNTNDECRFEDCVADCTCSVPCDISAEGITWCTETETDTIDGVRTSTSAGLNGIRQCGATRQSSWARKGEPMAALDGVGGNENNGNFMAASCTHTGQPAGGSSWWQVDLGDTARISHVEIMAPKDVDSIVDATVVLSLTADYTDGGQLCGSAPSTYINLATTNRYTVQCGGQVGSVLTVVQTGPFSPRLYSGNQPTGGGAVLSICEIEVWGTYGCLPCPPGTAASDNGTANCEQCSAGQFTAEPGSTECNVCVPGEIQVGFTCVVCPQGRYDADSTGTNCTACPAGTYSSTAGSFLNVTDMRSPCLPCPPLSFAAEGSAECTMCTAAGSQVTFTAGQPRQFSVSPRQIDHDNLTTSECVQCPAGLYSDGASCLFCDEPGHTLTDFLCAPCTRGRHSGPEGCADCPSGSYSLEAGSAECERCLAPLMPANSSRYPGFSPERSHCIVSPQSGGCVELSSCKTCRAGHLSRSRALDGRSAEAKAAALKTAYTEAWSHPTPAISTRSCGELNLTESGKTFGSESVCAGSEFGGSCFPAVSWAEADQICTSAGARLCSAAELQTDEARGSGCGLDGYWSWSSHPCGGGSSGAGHVVAMGSTRQSIRPRRTISANLTTNVARGKRATMFSTATSTWSSFFGQWITLDEEMHAGMAIDGRGRSGELYEVDGSIACVESFVKVWRLPDFSSNVNIQVPAQWWQVDLGGSFDIYDVIIYHRTESEQVSRRANGATVILSEAADYSIGVQCFELAIPAKVGNAETGSCDGNAGQFLTVSRADNWLSFCEIEVMGVPADLTVAQNSRCPGQCNSQTGGDCVCAARCSADASELRNLAAVRCCADAHQALNSVTAYASDPWYAAADAAIGNLRMVADGATMMLGGDGQLVQGTALEEMELPVEFRIDVDITPGPTTIPDWASVIHFTSADTDSDGHGARSPGIWFAPGSRELVVVHGNEANPNSNSGDWGCDSGLLTLLASVPSSLSIAVNGPAVQVFVNGAAVCDLSNPTNAFSGEWAASDGTGDVSTTSAVSTCGPLGSLLGGLHPTARRDLALEKTYLLGGVAHDWLEIEMDLIRVFAPPWSGLAIEYTADPCTGDGILVTDDDGSGQQVASSPTWDLGVRGYRPNVKCKWTMQCSAGLTAFLEFVTLNTETNWDFVFLFDGADTSTARAMLQWHGDMSALGDDAETSYVASGSTMTLLLTSDGSVQVAGFNAIFTCQDLAGAGGLGSVTVDAVEVGEWRTGESFGIADTSIAPACSRLAGLEPHRNIPDFVVLNGGSVYSELVQRASRTIAHTASTATLAVWVGSEFAIDNVKIRVCTNMAAGVLCRSVGLETFDLGPSCERCPAGRYLKQNRCDICPARTFSAVEGAVGACTTCPTGLLSPEGSTSSVNCTTTRPFLGCMQDRMSIEDRRDLDGKEVKMGANASLGDCRKLCKGFKFLGLQSSDSCFCGNSWGRYPAVVDYTQRYTAFHGGDREDGLDITGNFKYAVDIGGVGGYRLGDARFTDDSTFGVTHESEGRGFPENDLGIIGGRPVLGDSASDDQLEDLIQSGRWAWSSNQFSVQLDGLTPGTGYKLQLIWSPNLPASVQHDLLFGSAACGALGGIYQDELGQKRDEEVMDALLANQSDCKILDPDLAAPGLPFTLTTAIPIACPRTADIYDAPATCANVFTYQFVSETDSMWIALREARNSVDGAFDFFYMSALTLEELPADEVVMKPCGGDGAPACGSNSPFTTACEMANAVYANSEWLCSDHTCGHGRTHNLHTLNSTIFGESAESAELQCCIAAGNCPSGTRLDENARCQQCPAGRHSAAVNAAECSVCSAGHSSVAGASSCSMCQAGEYAGAGEPCTQCEAGRYSVDASQLCAGRCAAGTYSPGGTVDSCTPCSPGKVDADQNAATHCELCPADTFSSTAGSTSCTDCTGARPGSQSCSFGAAYSANHCPAELADCAAVLGCQDIVTATIHAAERPQSLDAAALALILCLDLASLTTSPPTGCTDSAASNYDAAAFVDAASCLYTCPAGTDCYIYSTDYGRWLPGAPPSSVIDASPILIQGTRTGVDSARDCRIDLFEDGLEWEDAGLSCRRQGGRLARLDAAAEADLLALMPGLGQVWIGLNDRAVEAGCSGSDFVWLNNESSTYGSYESWGVDMPNAYGCRTQFIDGVEVETEICQSGCAENTASCHPLNSYEDCVTIAILNGGTAEWDDHACGSKLPYACGYPCTNEVPSSANSLEVAGTSMELRGVAFVGNQAFGSGLKDMGSAIHVHSAAEVTMSYSKVADNRQIGAGSTIFVDAAKLNISFTQIESNEVHAQGCAGIFVRNSAEVHVAYSRIDENRVIGSEELPAGESAAAVSVDAARVTLRHTRIAYNSGGGAMVFRASTADLNHVSIRLNTDPRIRVDGAPTAAVLLLAGSKVNMMASTIVGNVGQAGGMVATGAGTIIVVESTTVQSNTGSTRTWSAGGVFLHAGASASFEKCQIKRNTVSAADAGGGFYVTDAYLIITNSTVDGNSITDVAGITSVSGAGGVRGEDARIDVQNSQITNNRATDSSGELLGAAFADGLYTRSPERLKVKYSAFTPLLAGQTVLISPGIQDDKVVGGCQQHPCEPGFSCEYKNYSLSCEPCSTQTFSPDGLACIACPQATGPNNESTACEPCRGDNYSSYGVCMPCDSRLVVSADRKTCVGCGVHRTPIEEVNGDRRCGCENTYVNASERVHVCFFGAYDEDEASTALRLQKSSRASTSQECMPCPADISGDGCLSCKDGAAGVSPGFTVPDLSEVSSSRRALLGVTPVDGLEVVTLFRCHIEMDLAIARCPGCADPPCACATGYKGAVCDGCAEGYGMDSGTRKCKPCEGTGYTWDALLLLIGIIVVVTAISGVLAKVWKAFPLKHLLRCAFQPVRILITYSQITSQLGDVLDFSYPGMFGEVIASLVKTRNSP